MDLKFEAIPPKDVGGDAFLVEADASYHIFRILKFLEFQWRDLSKNVFFNPPRIYGSQVMAKSKKKVSGHTNSNSTPLETLKKSILDNVWVLSLPFHFSRTLNPNVVVIKCFGMFWKQEASQLIPEDSQMGLSSWCPQKHSNDPCVRFLVDRETLILHSKKQES